MPARNFKAWEKLETDQGGFLKNRTLPQSDKLTFRQRRFVDEYLACGIGTKAVIAGYTGKHAHKVAFALTRQPKIKRAIQAAYILQQQRLERQQDILLVNMALD